MANPILEDFYQSVANPLVEIVNGTIMSLPGLIAALVVILVGYLVGSVLGKAVRKALHRLDFDKWFVKETKLSRLMGDVQASYIIDVIIKWWVFVLFLPPAASLVKLPSLAYFLESVGRIIPDVILAVLIMLGGLLAANYLAEQIEKTRAKGADSVAYAAKLITLLFVAIVALEQVGIQVGLARNAFLIILAGIVLGLALALGISFGLGGKKDAEKALKKLMRKL